MTHSNRVKLIDPGFQEYSESNPLPTNAFNKSDTATHTTFSIPASSTATEIASTNPNRIYSIIVNIGSNDAELFLLASSSVGTNDGIPLKGGTSASWESVGSAIYTGPLSVVSPLGTDVVIIEY